MKRGGKRVKGRDNGVRREWEMVRESECCCDNRRKCVGRKEREKEGDRKSV